MMRVVRLLVLLSIAGCAQKYYEAKHLRSDPSEQTWRVSGEPGGTCTSVDGGTGSAEGK